MYKLVQPINQIKYAREAAAVERCHTVPRIGHYDVGQHTFNMLSMLRILYPKSLPHLIWAVHGHDLAERLLGDIPAPVKWLNVVDKEALENLELEILEGVGLKEPLLAEHERRIVKSLDILELFLWTKDQEQLGNQNAKIMEIRILKWVRGNPCMLDPVVRDLFNEVATNPWKMSKDLGDQYVGR